MDQRPCYACGTATTNVTADGVPVCPSCRGPFGDLAPGRYSFSDVAIKVDDIEWIPPAVRSTAPPVDWNDIARDQTPVDQVISEAVDAALDAGLGDDLAEAIGVRREWIGLRGPRKAASPGPDEGETP